MVLSGCASAAPPIKPPPENLTWVPETPFAVEKKAEVPAEATGLFHFLKGNLLLGEGHFDEALALEKF